MYLLVCSYLEREDQDGIAPSPYRFLSANNFSSSPTAVNAARHKGVRAEGQSRGRSTAFYYPTMAFLH